ncbi:methylenetetrahydrofolate reductase [Brachybacterium saurashtrense]|uniref:methylenetetrahydrofolate reductase n=1 Tax=Brachybacterium saurashtrense TaxID=556288 RepID=UPI001F493E29|nr:methylenetetrahydrofolate reductase [Brachybacterium saurashtrense]
MPEPAERAAAAPEPASTPLPAPAPRRAQFEVIPLPGVLEQVLEHLGPGTRVTVTASPAQGLEATVETAIALAGAGRVAIPHLAARMLTGERELETILERLAGAGIEELFVIAGDADPPAGPYDGALALLEALRPARRGLAVGVGAHPEGHPFARPDEALELLRRKAEHASYLATQMLFAPVPLVDWVRQLRAAGIDLPVRPGLAAPASRARLLRIGARIGVGRSLRMLSAEGSGVRRLLSPGSWDPEPLRVAIAAAEVPGIAAPHVFTFNSLAETAAWWHGRAQRS